MTERVVTLAPDGPVTLATVNQLLSTLPAASRDQSLVLDLSRAGPLDSSALALVVTMKTRAARQGANFKLANIPDALRPLAQIYDLEEFIETCAK
jgi:ABC-type transporter Mla MlaB component